MNFTGRLLPEQKEIVCDASSMQWLAIRKCDISPFYCPMMTHTCQTSFFIVTDASPEMMLPIYTAGDQTIRQVTKNDANPAGVSWSKR
ncbi:hypothetical protein [Dickeya zeae]|jgi:hypothetical protein|uniref:hypothetical protein n=1 Tax=Dickeya zeae TaxID=204042 RepID=UPI001CF51044|nr:hypothetical protein [Dickeya zeae]MCA6988077.1 hypothetical protein [Dickeya zeae]UJR63047.1 hypothetical protein HJ586_13015 [Dickeya zeae]